MQTCYAAYEPLQEIDSFCDKLGGLAQFPLEVPHPECECGRKMHLIVQFKSEFTSYTRYSYLFGCNSLPCMKSSGSFKSIRCIQVHADVASLLKKEIKPVQKALFEIDSWGADSDDSFGFGGSEQAVSVSTVAEQLEASSISSKNSQPNKTKFITSKITEIFPAFALEFAQPPSVTVDYSHETKLLNVYKHTNALDLTTKPKPADEWAGEGYEKTEIEETLVSSHFQKFTEAVALDPESCMRYDFGGKPLWYSAKRSPAACEYCGAARVFEFQVLPYILKSFGLEDTLSLEDGMDFGTAMVFVCGNDCFDGDSCWRSEHVILQGEFTTDN
jgi:Programmed cell death protein 2, C-terminal putative domain